MRSQLLLVTLCASAVVGHAQSTQSMASQDHVEQYVQRAVERANAIQTVSYRYALAENFYCSVGTFTASPVPPWVGSAKGEDRVVKVITEAICDVMFDGACVYVDQRNTTVTGVLDDSTTMPMGHKQCDRQRTWIFKDGTVYEAENIYGQAFHMSTKKTYEQLRNTKGVPSAVWEELLYKLGLRPEVLATRPDGPYRFKPAFAETDGGKTMIMVEADVDVKDGRAYSTIAMREVDSQSSGALLEKVYTKGSKRKFGPKNEYGWKRSAEGIWYRNEITRYTIDGNDIVPLVSLKELSPPVFNQPLAVPPFTKGLEMNDETTTQTTETTATL